MPNSSKNLRSMLALLLCGLLVVAGGVGNTSPAAAFGMFGFARGGGGFGPRPGPMPGGGQWGRMPPPRFGGPPVRGWPSGHPPVGGGPVGGGAVGGGGAPGGGNNNGGNGGGGGGGTTAQADQSFVPDEIITAFASGTTPQAINRVAQRYGLTELETQNFPLIGTSLYRWRIGGGRSVANAIRALGSENTVASVQPNYIFTLQDEATKPPPSATQGDPAQYVLDKLQIVQAQRIATGKDVVIAVIDSAIDASHPDLGGTIVKNFDAVPAGQNPNAHGTAIAGAIAAHGKLLGIAPGAQILAVHAFDDTPGVAKGTSFAIDKGLQWAADNGARIVNMSFAGPADPLLQRLLAAAYDKGMVLIAAAGNAGPQSAPLFPAAYPDVIAVTATDGDDHLFANAVRGRHIALATPGVEILALAPGDKYAMSTGTSIAAAHVSGIAALLLERKPALRPSDIRAVLIATVKPLGPPHPDSEFGAGLANAYRAVTWLDRTPTEPGPGDAQAKQ